MKRSILPIILALIAGLPALAGAQAMTDYCSAPPYVSRNIPPNVIILMDNSEDMLQPAYTGDYDASTINSVDTQYIGYFKPEGCYKYDTNKFVEVLEVVKATDKGADFGDSYTKSVTCPSTAPFRGNLLNWAATSKFDLVQKVLIGGNTTSKQDNAHTLISISGVWADKNYPNSTSPTCIFRVNNGNLTILDYTSGSCTLLDTPAVPLAFWKAQWWSSLVERLRSSFDRMTAAFGGGMKRLTAATVYVWDSVLGVPLAWGAAACNPITVSSSLYGFVNTPYSLVLDAGGCNNCTFTWTMLFTPVGSAPPLTWSDSYFETATKKTKGRAMWTTTPTDPGQYTYSATVSSPGCNNTMTSNGTITIQVPLLQINTTALPAGSVGASYSFTLQGQGGQTPYSWSATGLPAGLTLNSATGVISGTPTASGTFSVQITLNDSYDGNNPDPMQTYTLVISAPALTITTDTLPDADKALSYYPNDGLGVQLQATGGTTPYGWTLSLKAGEDGLPPDLTLSSSGKISGDPRNSIKGAYSFTVRVTDNASTYTEKKFTIAVKGVVTPVIVTNSLPDAVKGVAYSYTLVASGGTGTYTWSITSGSLPSCLSLTASTGTISGSSCGMSDVGTYTITVKVTDSAAKFSTKDFTLKVVKSATTRSQSFDVQVQLNEEPLNDQNGNGYYDGLPDTFTDYSANGTWEGKYGIFQQFWSDVSPRARWGLATFSNQVMSQGVDIDSCIPASPASSFYTRIQNATPADNAPLDIGLFGVINYFRDAADPLPTADDWYRGCSNSKPLDSVTCRKNFVLLLSSGFDVTNHTPPTPQYAPTGCTTVWGNTGSNLVKNACWGFKNDLRTADSSKQILNTFVVNTMGSNAANAKVLEDAAIAGGGKYYSANKSNIASQLRQAFTDILAQAASGTAVSVLTTSSRGVGSVVQAYFLPATKEGTKDIWWTGYMQNLWIDPQDNLREDSEHDYNLKLDSETDTTKGDKVLKLYFNKFSNEAEVALFTTDAEGADGTLGTCTSPEKKIFREVTYLWEAGRKLALNIPYGDRNIFTSNTVIRGASSKTLPKGAMDKSPKFTTSMDATELKSKLNEDPSFLADDIIDYIRGKDLENTKPTLYRDRQLTIKNDSNVDQKVVWKLGDIISSTPRVLANMPLNSYHIDYTDQTYYNYLSSDTYKKATSVAFVGANDGMLHAFRVGYLKDKDDDNGQLLAGVKALFRDSFSSADSAHGELGKELWGYIPYNAFPYLKYYASLDYPECHLYYNDLSVYLFDASIAKPSACSESDAANCAKATDSWRTILIGGMRFGGACGTGGLPANPPNATGTTDPLDTGYSSFYAIDITDRANPTPLWEFSDADLGYATTFPALVRLGSKDTNGHWYFVVGSGSKQLPRSSPIARDIGRTAKAYIYFLDLATGEMVKKVDTGSVGIVGDMIAVDLDKNYRSERIYYGTSYYDTTELKWHGKIQKISIGETDANADLSTQSLSATTLFDGPYPFTAAPEAAKDEYGKVWVYAGSGKYFSEEDERDVSAQIFMGFEDKDAQVTEGGVSSDCPSSCANGSLCDVTKCTTTGTVGSTKTICTYDSTANSFGPKQVVTSIASTSTAPKNDTGWKIYLGTMERVISSPLAVGGLVDYLTYVPNSDFCAYGGDSYLYSVGYKTGVAPTNVAIRAPDATSGTSGSVTVYNKVLLGPGAPPTGRAIIIPPQKEGQEQLKKKIQVATGVIVEAENRPAISTTSKVIQWLKK